MTLRGKSESDPHDGAVHILGVDHQPLCGRAVQLCYAVTQLYGPQPDPGQGCWTCMKKRRAITGESGIAATVCPDCGAELRKPSDPMRHECPIALARAVRLGNRKAIAPSRLYALCRGDGALYNHALREAGYIVAKATGRPEDPCGICGWSPTA